MNDARFVLSRSKVLERYEFLKKICPVISYSIKTNPDVGKILEKDTDSFFSIHTPEGLGWIDDYTRVWYLAQSLNKKLLSKLFERGVENFIVDNEPDLEVLVDYIKSEKKTINLLLRMRFEETTVYKGRYFLFGLDSGRINELIPELRKNQCIKKLGIHFHRNTQNIGNWSLKYLIEERLDKNTLKSIDLMNIGGGIPVKYKNTSDSNLPYILEKINELKKWLESYGIIMIIEPGRPICAPSIRLETYITLITGRDITVNCSVYNSSLDTIIVPHKLLVDGEGEGSEYTIKGCTPCSMDIFRYDVRLKNPKVGDKIVFLNAGAYNWATDFCNLKKTKTVITE
jgi:ornithine decarboxylase